MLTKLGLPVALGDTGGAGLEKRCFCAQLELVSPQDRLQSCVPEKGKAVSALPAPFEEAKMSKALSSACNIVKILLILCN